MSEQKEITRPFVCPKHGNVEERAFQWPWSKELHWCGCGQCVNEAAEEEQRRIEERERKAAEARIASRIGTAGIPERFRDRTLSNFVARSDGQKRALEFCERYANEFVDVQRSGKCALFLGRPGTGKTHLACGIGLHLIRNANKLVVFTTVQRAIRRVKDTWARGSSESESGVIDALVNPDLLILDEVGVQFGSDFEKNVLFDVLNERYERRRPTLLMSNLPRTEISAYLGDRIMDRMAEDGAAIIVFDWGSYRRPQETEGASR